MQLLYGYDPLCGWCYGFGPALRHLRSNLPDLQVHPVMGGLVTGARIGRYADMGGYIRKAAARMKGTTGVAPSSAFFDLIIRNPEIVASSLVPCAAVLQVRNMAPDRAADFASAVQAAHFADGDDLNNPRVYDRIAKQLGLTIAFDLKDCWTVTPALAAEFEATREIGIQSYPTLILEKAGRLVPVSTAYEPAKAVSAVLDAIHGR